MEQTDELTPLRQLHTQCEADFRAIVILYPDLLSPKANARFNAYVDLCKQTGQLSNEGEYMPAKDYRLLGEDMENVAVRLPRSVLAEVDTHIERLRTVAPWARCGRSDALRDLVLRGLASIVSLTATESNPPIEPPPIPHETLTPPLVSHKAPTLEPELHHTPATIDHGRAPKPPRELPAYVLKIAETAANHEELSTRELSQLLFDRNIYRARDSKTGEEKPVSPGTLARWLKEARTAGLL